MTKTLTIQYPDTMPDDLNLSPGEFEREVAHAQSALPGH